MARSAETIRIGGAAGFWGDSMLAAPQLVAGGGLDFLTFDYLAEITMSIMAKARTADVKAGYATDFVDRTLASILADCKTGGIRILANAGGVNPDACADAVRALAARLGVAVKVGVVTGDDLLSQAEAFHAAGGREMFSDAVFPDHPLSINAYLGAFPVAAALDAGADIVITGRCADSALALGACIHRFGWGGDDFDRLAAGSLAGHVIECGAQATGGLFTDWKSVADDWDTIGYPIVEVAADGSFLVSKPAGTGGLVSVGTVSEQIVYEIGDPQAYILPDVVCDFSAVTVTQVAPDVVRVAGARGAPPTDRYKVSATYQDGSRLGTFLTITGIDAPAKARATATAILRRTAAMLARQGKAPFTETCVELLGTESSYGPNARGAASREVVLKLAAKHPEPGPLAMLLREATSAGTSMAAGTTGMGGNRPRVLPVVRLFSFLVPKAEVPVEVRLDGAMVPYVAPPLKASFDASAIVRPEPAAGATAADNGVTVPLVALAFARSGDKGDTSNIGVIARSPDYLPWIRAGLPPEAVAAHFAHLVKGAVTRFDLPGMHAINFLMLQALAGGGVASLRNDPQGKAMAQLLLDIPIRVPAELARRDGLAMIDPPAQNQPAQ